MPFDVNCRLWGTAGARWDDMLPATSRKVPKRSVEAEQPVWKMKADDGWRSPPPRQGGVLPGLVGAGLAEQAAIGATITLHSGVHFRPARGNPSCVLQPGEFTGIDTTDRQILSDWLDQAGPGGIDTIIDLTLRPWQITGAQAIIGVFEKDKVEASWLMVRNRSGWVLARCNDRSISDVSAALPDILALIDLTLV